ncbi:MAG: hypothetical protein KJO60_13960 [Desulfofustis sp.]|nr:hypothetical protein [Desulfofustis sp.]
MYFLAASFLLALLAVPFNAYSFTLDLVPESLGSNPVLTRTEEMRIWSPDNMYEHVNGEAELLIRYGTRGLGFSAYENEAGDYVSVDILDLGEPINAYGLYRLYAGCDGEELQISGATVLVDDYTQYGFYDRYFLRINLDTGDSTDDRTLVEDFLIHLTGQVPEPSRLPPALAILQQSAGKPCEVNYHPEHIDYDLETGPGYSWVDADGESYAAIILDSEESATHQSNALTQKGLANLTLYKNGVIWNKADTGEPTDYMKQTIEQIVEQ